MDSAGMNEGYPQLFGNPENPNLVARVRGQLVALAEPAFLIQSFPKGGHFPAWEQPALYAGNLREFARTVRA
jgi:pimeloyl-ACP methyl ester carboxylesterase